MAVGLLCAAPLLTPPQLPPPLQSLSSSHRARGWRAHFPVPPRSLLPAFAGVSALPDLLRWPLPCWLSRPLPKARAMERSQFSVPPRICAISLFLIQIEKEFLPQYIMFEQRSQNSLLPQFSYQTLD